MSKSEKGQEVAKEAAEAAKKAGKVIGAGLSKFSKKMVAGAKGFKEGMKDADTPSEKTVQEPVAEYDEVVEEVKTEKTPASQGDYSLDDE